MTTTNTRRIATPAVYRFSHLPWGWMKLSEIAEAINMSPKEVWIRYFPLSKDTEYNSVTTQETDLVDVDPDGQVVGANEFFLGGRRSFRRAVATGEIYVAALFGKRVLELHRQGVRRVVLEAIESVDSRRKLPFGVFDEVYTSTGNSYQIVCLNEKEQRTKVRK